MDLNSIKRNDASNFVTGQMVYCHQLGEYVQIKRKDVENPKEGAPEVVTFRCTVAKVKEENLNDGNAEASNQKEVTLTPKEIGKFIQVRVMV